MRSLAIAFFFAAAFVAGCTQHENADNRLTADEAAAGWTLLFDGKTMDGWHLYKKGKIMSSWSVKDGALICTPAGKLEHGDLLTDSSYTNYDLRFDWKISKAGNSGVFINVLEREDLPTAWTSGPEYQLLESSHHDVDIPVKRSGCLYGFAPQRNAAALNPEGAWNHSQIIQTNGKIKFYLNGVLTAEEDFTSPEWPEKIAATNFKNFPEFGKRTSGHLALQDWNTGIAFKNIKLKTL